MERHIVLIFTGAVLILAGLVVFAMLGYLINDPSVNAVETVRIPDPGGSERVSLEAGTYEVWVEVTERSGFIRDIGVETAYGRFVWGASSPGLLEDIGDTHEMGSFEISDPGTYVVFSNDGVKIMLTEPGSGSPLGTILGIVIAVVGIVLLVVGMVMRSKAAMMASGASQQVDLPPPGWRQPPR